VAIRIKAGPLGRGLDRKPTATVAIEARPDRRLGSLDYVTRLSAV